MGRRRGRRGESGSVAPGKVQVDSNRLSQEGLSVMVLRQMEVTQAADLVTPVAKRLASLAGDKSSGPRLLQRVVDAEDVCNESVWRPSIFNDAQLQVLLREIVQQAQPESHEVLLFPATQETGRGRERKGMMQRVRQACKGDAATGRDCERERQRGREGDL